MRRMHDPRVYGETKEFQHLFFPGSLAELCSSAGQNMRDRLGGDSGSRGEEV